MTKVPELLHKGVPVAFRPFVWQHCCGAFESPLINAYKNYLDTNSPCERQIKRDINRTFPTHEKFKTKDGDGQTSLFNVVKAYSIYDREVGYCQGSAFIVGLLLIQMPEEEAFACFVQFMYKYQLRDLYKPDMAMLGVRMYQLDGLVEEYMPDLYLHFIQYQFPSSLYASGWFLTLFSISIGIEFSIRVIDLFLCEGIDIVFKVALAILKLNEQTLLSMDMEAMLIVGYFLNPLTRIQCLQHDLAESMNNPDLQAELFAMTKTFRLNPRTMKRMEKEYQNRVNQEREEQIELKDSKQITEQLINTQIKRANENEQLQELRNELTKTHSELSYYRDGISLAGEDELAMRNANEDQSSCYNIPAIPLEELNTPCSPTKDSLQSQFGSLPSQLGFKSSSSQTDSPPADPRPRATNLHNELRMAKRKITLLEQQLTDLCEDREKRRADLEAELMRLKKREAKSLLRVDECESRLLEIEKLWSAATYSPSSCFISFISDQLRKQASSLLAFYRIHSLPY
ncbi:hypothetical protein Ciccas_007999 [Cichlidogyrus casuarinus]|uniref:Rab-GAP TBC domain-containing protein n=1 Tax=Cichlidogyrus casuarinus TaxID=1844966 RepID=A0ABD2Q5D0_9PLAT